MEKGFQWDEVSFIAKIEADFGSDSARVAKALLDWIIGNGLRIYWGQGKTMGSCTPLLDFKNETYFLFAMWTTGGVEIQFQHMLNRPLYSDISRRQQLLDDLNSLSGVHISQDRIDKRPSIPYLTFNDEIAINQFMEIWDNYIQEIKAKA